MNSKMEVKMGCTSGRNQVENALLIMYKQPRQWIEQG